MGATINADKQNSNLIQSVDWTKHSVEEWLEQYGLWVNDQRTQNTSNGASPLATLQDSRSDGRCRGLQMRRYLLRIDDNEAQAVMRLLIDLKALAPCIGSIVIAHIEQYRSFAVIAAMTQGQLSKSTVIKRYREGCEYLKKRMGLGDEANK